MESVPEECYNKTFENLFMFLLSRDLIALGLYRGPGATDNKTPYVYTNPEGCTITQHDKVFVLGVGIPEDLVVGQEQAFMPKQADNSSPDNQLIFTKYAEGDVLTLNEYYGYEERKETEESFVEELP